MWAMLCITTAQDSQKRESTAPCILHKSRRRNGTPMPRHHTLYTEILWASCHYSPRHSAATETNLTEISLEAAAAGDGRHGYKAEDDDATLPAVDRTSLLHCTQNVTVHSRLDKTHNWTTNQWNHTFHLIFTLWHRIQPFVYLFLSAGNSQPMDGCPISCNFNVDSSISS